MKSIARTSRRWKEKVTSRRKPLADMMKLKEIDDIDIKVSLIQALIPLGLEAVNNKLQEPYKEGEQVFNLNYSYHE